MKKAIVFAGLFLTGCATHGPVLMGDGVYMMTKNSAGGAFSSGQGAEEKLLRKANDFCGKQGKEIKTVDAATTHGVPFVRPASAEIHFRCVDRKS